MALFGNKPKSDDGETTGINPGEPRTVRRSANGDATAHDRGYGALLPRLAPEYGIDRAIELMRQLPEENLEVVVRVVKITLKSLGIDVDAIIKDGERKEKDIEANIGVLREEIAELQQKIHTRGTEIAALDAEERETRLVRERLALPEKASGREPIAERWLPNAPMEVELKLAAGTHSPAMASSPDGGLLALVPASRNPHCT